MGPGGLSVPDEPILPFIEGDGTGPDIWRSSVRVIDAAVNYMIENAADEGFHEYEVPNPRLFDSTFVEIYGDDWAVVRNVYNPGERLEVWNQEIPMP